MRSPRGATACARRTAQLGLTILFGSVGLAGCGGSPAHPEDDASLPGDAGPCTGLGCTSVFCGTNEHVMGNLCVPCPAGTTNIAGDDSPGPDTSCDHVRCGANERVASNACEPCSAGSTNLAGDDASGADTACDATLCGLNERVTGNECEACPPDATNAGGDDASGPDTVCDGTLCGEDERVRDHACAPCPTGSTNAAGDDAVGPDTTCHDACSAVVGLTCAELEQAYIKASNTGAGDLFGIAVALSGDTLAVGAPREDSASTGIDGDQSSNAAEDSGAVYVFVRSDTTWSQQAYVKASNTEAGDFFGSYVALDGDTLAVGAPPESSGSGAVYVFVRSGSTWSQQAYLEASNAEEGDGFGRVALSGDTLAVGAQYEGGAATGVNGDQASNAAPASGAVYVFFRSGTTWSQQAYLKASNTDANDLFGSSIALSGDTLAVGAFFEDSAATGVNGDQMSDAAEDSGAVYLFVRSGTTWSQQAYLKASNADAGDRFGAAVALSGDTLAVGAVFEDSAATGIDGDQVSNAADDSGAVYVFVRSGTTWSQQAYLKASNTDGSDLFGSAVALSGETLAIGAPFEASAATGLNGDQASNTASLSGALYFFVRSGSTWSQQAYLKASNTDANDFFGNSVVLSGDTLVVAAPSESGAATGVNGDETSDAAMFSGAVYVRLLGLR